ncbi:hypothetical protein K488DRAFT_88819 [Vararia minispora EC-137]|uniref:Uncharacterized protein n=1 Tax=Vararia minispora EC-137 TaxID=1314806 RepID=A0ACB8QBX4_9AGAM|nr:hypothetical protein K488DRAFT_88819 [Vararia minispora EC-137]
MPLEHFQSWWTFVITLVNDHQSYRRRQHMRLPGSDLYWRFLALRALDSRRDSSLPLVTHVIPRHDASLPVPGPKKLKLLQKILSPENIHSLSPIIRTASDLRKFYFSSNHAASRLEDSERSMLISLFGTLSLTPNLANPFLNPLAAYMPYQSRRPWWGFIWKLITDQKAAVRKLNEHDFFWLVMAHMQTGNLSRLPLPSLLPLLLTHLHSDDRHRSPPTAQTLHDLYLISGRNRQKLDVEEHSKLITLFATLSSPAYVQDCYLSRMAARVPQKPGSSWWKFVIVLIRDKRQTKPLSASDSYWLVVARLHVSGHMSVVVDANRDNALRDARQRLIGLSTSKVLGGSNHEAYISFLLSAGRLSALEEAIGWLHVLMGRTRIVLPSVQALFWRAALDDRVISSTQMKESLLSIVTDHISLSRPKQTGDFCDGSLVYRLPTKAVDLLLHTSNYILPGDDTLDGLSPSQLIVKDWSHFLAHAMFRVDSPLEMRWRNLTFLAVINSPDASLPSVLPLLQMHEQTRLHPVDPRVLLLLSLLERLGEQHRLDSEFQPLVHQLWNRWNQVVSEHPGLHATLVRPILASFFAIAARMRDNWLCNKAITLASEKQWIWAFTFGDDHAQAQVQSLVSDYVCAAAICGEVSWERILRSVPRYTSFPQWHPMLVGRALLRMAPIDPVLTFDLYLAWSAHLAIPGDYVASMCQTYAQNGRVDISLRLLEKGNWTSLNGQHALVTVLVSLQRVKAPLEDVRVLQTLSRCLHAVVNAPHFLPKYNHGTILWIILKLIRRGNCAFALRLIRVVQNKHPHYFPPRDVENVVRLLLRRWDFTRALDLIKSYRNVFDRRTVSKWARLAAIALTRTEYHDVQYMRADLRALTHRARLLITEPEISRDPYLAMVFHYRLKRRHRGLRMRLVRFTTTPPGKHEPRAPSFIPALLVILGRFGWHRFERALEQLLPVLTDSQRTKIGNAVLCYWIDRRIGHVRLEEQLEITLSQLHKRIGFTPDRVTLNLLVKRLLRPHSFTKHHTRALFNLLVEDGYPVPPPWSRDRPPFVTEWTFEEPKNWLAPIRETVKDLPMHPRVVKRLYRLFFDKFRDKREQMNIDVMRQILRWLPKEDDKIWKERNWWRTGSSGEAQAGRGYGNG